MEEIKAYKCDYCSKYSISKKYIKTHEKECYHNPVTKACATCKNCESVGRERKSSTGEYLVTEMYSICTKGITISILREDGFKRCLQHHCKAWEERPEVDEEEDEDEAYAWV